MSSVTQASSKDQSNDQELSPESEGPDSSPVNQPFNSTGTINRARHNPGLMTSSDILQLQRTIGNQAVGRILAGKKQLSTGRAEAFNPRSEATLGSNRQIPLAGRSEDQEDGGAVNWEAPIEEEADTRTEKGFGLEKGTLEARAELAGGLRKEDDEDGGAVNWEAPIEEEADTRTEKPKREEAASIRAEGGTGERSRREDEDNGGRSEKLAGRIGVVSTVSRAPEVASTIQRVPTFPSYAVIVAGIRAEMDTAWEETLTATTATSRREQGFWIRWNSSTKAFSSTGKAIAPTVTNTVGATINLPAKPADAGDEYTVASFHTHTPTRYRSVGRPVGPSGADLNADNGDNVAGVVYDYIEAKGGNIPAGHPLRSRAQLYSSGPNKRA